MISGRIAGPPSGDLDDFSRSSVAICSPQMNPRTRIGELARGTRRVGDMKCIYAIRGVSHSRVTRIMSGCLPEQ